MGCKSSKDDKTPLGTPMSSDIRAIWQVYFDIFKRRWGMDPKVA